MNKKGDNRAFVFIDGGNFYFKLKSLTEKIEGKYALLDFDFYSFSKWLVLPNELVDIRYYVGAVKQKRGNFKSEKLYADQQRLIAKLQTSEITVILGNLIQHPDKSYHEKGVDVRLAVEMIRFARQDKYDIAHLVSSDTDLVPAVEEVQSSGKKVQYTGIAKGQSYGLTEVSDDIRLLRPEDIKSFLPEVLV